MNISSYVVGTEVFLKSVLSSPPAASPAPSVPCCPLEPEFLDDPPNHPLLFFFAPWVASGPLLAAEPPPASSAAPEAPSSPS
eukprot:CAMPEP_0115443482 /NCGR_PEP_ID=MMETSP0271-20121206/37891_1 /TAXON_ID=71861 /ORGANISM="Scrippsiella trochoidea, Strain CCMP3099" /LENGTH=81 /DNA_ID=CAMNT_0002869359 /DNA_START=56 /DNA_END=297 /DNA_ORIENTATION=-